MGIIDQIRNYFYESVLRQRGPGAPRRITNMADAKTVGIIYDSTMPGYDTIIAKYADSLRAKGKTVEVLAYLDDKKIESKPGINIFNKKAVNWYGIPIDDRVAAFCNKNFDLLLCAITDESKPLEYMAYISKAKYRVGPFAESKTRLFDFMVQLDGRRDLGYLLQQATYFLDNIKYN
ncbi:MAG: hypothetical protein JSS76_19015 [Bacteroidetes bacterium]|nr:hypothetical protein [Bacteroidota bacterium]